MTKSKAWIISICAYLLLGLLAIKFRHYLPWVLLVIGGITLLVLKRYGGRDESSAKAFRRSLLLLIAYTSGFYILAAIILSDSADKQLVIGSMIELCGISSIWATREFARGRHALWGFIGRALGPFAAIFTVLFIVLMGNIDGRGWGGVVLLDGVLIGLPIIVFYNAGLYLVLRHAVAGQLQRA